ncbi:ATP-binding protein [Leptothermofonsia sp. ETS-13]|uniref:ATP-binding protein n=1 Tax=Leptothermofonsia sp. ETS-13 TaxID=3035696 RepID=UPI003BA0103E
MAGELINSLWFLAGLLAGLVLLSWYRARMNSKLKQLVRLLQPDALSWSFSSTSQLIREITAHTEEHQNLLARLEVWHQICQSAPTGFFQVDQDNQLIWCNPKACEMLGIQPSQLPVRPRLLLEVVRSYELDQLIGQTRAAGKPCSQDWIFHPSTPDPSILSQQSPYPLRGYGIPLPNDSVGVFLENRQEAVSLTQQRDRWISDVAHELKTPLTSIRLVAETLQLRLDPPLRDWVDRLLKETIRLSNLVQDLLDLSQLEARPSPQLNFKTLDLNKLVQSAWAGLEPLAHQKRLQFNYIGPEHLLIEADESRLHRALLNLLDNSIKYSPEQALIQVRISLLPTAEQPQQICLEVIDSGPGFPESALPHVFERFYRADPSRTRSIAGMKVPGSKATTWVGNAPGAESFKESTGSSQRTLLSSGGNGLGLAIVRQIVEAHGGSVKASNHPETHGAWLQVFLPYQESIS